jgi:cell division protein FtsZ
MLVSFARGDEWIDRAVRSLWGMLHRPGLINLDFASLREAFTYRGGKTLYGLGSGEGEDAVNAALDDFLDCPLLHTPENARKADRLLVNITGGTELSLTAVQHIMSVIAEKFGREPHVALGAVIDESWQRRVEIVVIGTTDLNGRGTRRMPERAARSREAARRAAGAATATGAATDTNALLDLAVSGRSGAEHAGAARPRGGATATMSTGAQTATAHIHGGAGTPKMARWPARQDEFAFADEESRGAFDDGQRTIFEGEDLDIPTYRRRGIKLAL